ncbi:MAG TPA: SCE4755 family polysaccharide monooxygenase-like protein [Kofleriaceae bacterium]|nr:SCE4755 family polysaccharide monooxygenase-like protein [Kofleriaceae bacterium]
MIRSRLVRIAVALALGLGTLAWSRAALAHIDLEYPPMRGGNQKVAPCEGAPRGEPTVLAPGQTITVKWHETIDHDSHYRIAFDPDGEDDFIDPVDVDDFDNSNAVLVDDLPDEPNGSYIYQLTLPNLQCETCTLQVIQVMYSGDSFAGNYHRCADLALRGASAGDAGVVGSDGDDGGCQVGSGPGGSAAGVVLVLAAIALASRRRRAHSRGG